MLLLFEVLIEKSLAPFIYTYYTRPPPVGGGTSTSAVVDEPKEEAKEINALNSSVWRQAGRRQMFGTFSRVY